MNIRCFLLAASLLLKPVLAQASDNVEHGSSAILSLRQLSDLSADQLLLDIVNLLGQTLTELEPHGVWLHEGADKRWVSFKKIVADMQSFRDTESSKAEIKAVLRGKEQIKDGLLLVLSAQWNEGLEDLMIEHRHDNFPLNPCKAYAAAFLAYYTVERTGAWDGARNTPMIALSSAAWEAAWAVVRDASHKAVQSPIKQKLAVLGFTSPHQHGVESYDLAELFSLLWLIEIGHDYMKMAVDAAYAKVPEMELTEAKAKIKASIDRAAIKRPELEGNMFVKALWRDLDAMEKFILGK